ncbi:MAG: asparagine synthase (glutamine-hydrolyzing) [Bacteroidota bacterium]|nr:asparagine synthase (glutamine-hydrolyzing) [Bacteroidota bacterium]
MCGIAGFIDFNSVSSKEVLEKMTNTLIHRGPDAGVTQILYDVNTQIGLGHRRLSIIELSSLGAQPMKHKHLWITYNGEIYNYIEIKKELQNLGYQFISNSDTEVIIQAFEQWGIECLHKFIGMFAFVIYDTLNREIFCVRDRVGIKPFYYYWHNNLFLFASELKAFHEHPHFIKELNFDAVASFIQFGNVPTPHCIFNNCHKLKPGHYLRFSLETRKVEQITYWNVYDHYNKPKLNISFEEAKTETEKILTSAFNYRMVADVPVGVFLSGGYDSTCVTALLQKNNTKKIKTFTIAVPDIGLNEAPYAQEVAKYIGTEHYEFDCTQKEAIELIDKLPYYYDEPFADSSAIPTTLVSLMARKQVTVALSADGGDEIFAGYNRYDYLMKHGKLLQQLPTFIRKGTLKMMTAIPSEKIPGLRNKYNFHNRYLKLKSLLSNPSAQNMMFSLSKQMTDRELTDLFRTNIITINSAYLSDELKQEFYSPLAFMQAIDYQTYLLDDILQKVDRASMTASLEGREPFLDHRIIEFVAQLPDSYKYHKGIKKYLLKEIVHKYVPKNIMNRPKMGFAIPIEKWLMKDLKEKVLECLSPNKLEKQGIFDLKEVEKIKLSFFEGKTELATKIWHLYMFQLWYQKWMS